MIGRSVRNGQAKLLTVSNRGPVEFRRDEEGQVIAVPGSGGLATALRVAAQLYPTTWLSSPISPLDRQMAAEHTAMRGDDDAASVFVATDERAYELFYGTFANQVLWFLQHSLPWPQELTAADAARAWREGYAAVNTAFAEAIAAELERDVYRAVVFHDYHFYLAPRLVRRMRPEVYLQHFVHIPWPEPQEWGRLDDGIVTAICDGLLANDSLAFQTPRDAGRFLATCAAYLSEADVDAAAGYVRYQGGSTRVWANGISVDVRELVEAAATPEFSRYRYLLRPGPGMKTIVRVDRMDPTKNVIAGFEAYALLLERHPELRERVYFLAHLFPSRSGVSAYQRYEEEARARVEAVNRRFGTFFWKPVRLVYEHNRMQALAAMSLYDVLLVNPLADGMNLVAKEGPVLNTRDGVLVLSSEAGAHAELACGAISIDPRDVDGTAEALYQALTMPAEERRERALRLRNKVRGRDLRDWFRALLADIDRNAPLPSATTVA